MKRQKSILGIALSIFLIIMMNTLQSFGAEFPFTDVLTDTWYYHDVKEAYDNGLIDGFKDKTFRPDETITFAQTVKLAACINQKSISGTITLKNGTPNWYESYALYAKDKGIISKSYDWNTSVTRKAFAEIFANALPDEELKEKNTIVENAIPDVSMSHPQAASIYKLYRAGILTGKDEKGTFDPDSVIHRSEISAILTRMMRESARKSLTLSEVYQPKGRCYEVVISDVSWTQAQQKAVEKGGYLACFETQYEYDAFIKILNTMNLTKARLFLGGRRDDNQKEYYWVDEENQFILSDRIDGADYWAKSNWLNTEPSFQWHGRDENRLQIQYDENSNRWVWNDVMEDVAYPGHVQYGYVVEYNKENETTTVSFDYDLNDTVICNFGDSLFSKARPPYDISTRLAKLTGSTVYNCSFGGCQMGVYPNDERWDAFSMYRLADSIVTGNWTLQDNVIENGDMPDYFSETLTLLKSIDWNDVDIITIAYGTNDFSNGLQPVQSRSPTPDDNMFNAVGTALQYSAQTIQSAYPNVRIFVCLPMYRVWLTSRNKFDYDSNTATNTSWVEGETQEHAYLDFVEAERDVARSNRLTVIDTYYDLGINQNNWKTYFPSGDGIHHNQKGRDLIAEKMAEVINNYQEIYESQ